MMHSVFVYWGELEVHWRAITVRLMTALLWLQIKMKFLHLLQFSMLLYYFNKLEINCHLKFILRLERWLRSPNS